MDIRFLVPLLISLVALPLCSPARILALIPFTGKSHYINIQPILQELAERGHDLTVVTTHFEKKPLPNYHQIILDNITFWDSFGKNMDKFSFENMAFSKEMKLLWDGTYFSTEVAFNSTSLQEFIRNDNSHFDLIFMELFLQEAFYLFAHKYKAPIVAISTMGFTQYLSEFMGNPIQMSYMPHEFLSSERTMSLWKRLDNLYYTAYDILGRRLYVQPKHEKLLDRHFKNLPKPWPSLCELEKTVSVVLINTHYSIDTIRPHVPGIVEIGGVHIKPPKPLSESLQKFLDEAEHGVVFFSLGSNLKSKDMPQHKIDMFLKVFSRLKERVLWKWEDDNMPGKPDNVLTGPWLPQTEILAHPNVKVFIFHGGLLSTLEAIHFGVPVIGIPVYGDQHLNAAKAESLGFGLKLAFSFLTEEGITNALNEILSNSRYAEVAKQLSIRFRDRPRTPMETAIYWIEYVIRHKGAKFMRSPVLDLRWYEYHMIDAMFVIFGALVIFIVLVALSLKMLVKMIYRQCKTKEHNKEDKKRK